MRIRFKNLWLSAVSSLLLLCSCGDISDEEVACYAWKEAGGAFIADNIVFGTDSVNEMIIGPERRITLRGTYVGRLAKATSTELVIELPDGREAEFRKLTKICP